MASPTVRRNSAASSEISKPNSCSNLIASSTISRLSAPRSSMKLAESITASVIDCKLLNYNGLGAFDDIEHFQGSVIDRHIIEKLRLV
jgi:hypothetical protein